MMTINMEELHIGHYILGKTIGAGGFAKVKEARHDQTGVKVAVKILNKRKMKNKNMIAKVKRQIKILKFINHQNIIKLYEVLDTTNDIFVIMELAQKGELYEYIQNNDISELEARFFFKQIINGIGYAHCNLISHRDLKPENILIDSNRLIKIVDFGLSNVMKDGKLLKTTCGSPNYAAPQIVGERKYEGTSVDIWSCGVILYALLVGSLPFDQETMTLLYRKIEQGQYHIPRSINPVAADLIRRMLQVDPYQRIRINQIFHHPWIREYTPLYVHMPTYHYRQIEEDFELDLTIFEAVKRMNFPDTNEVTDEKLKKSIKKKDDNSFAITYQLLKDQKDRKQNAQQSLAHYTRQPPQGRILNDIHNEVIPLPIKNPSAGSVYGRRFTKPLKILVEMMINAFKRNGIQFTVKSKQYTFKCLYKRRSRIKRAPSTSSTASAGSEMIDEDGDSDKSGKQDIKFMVQVFAADLRGFEHMVDLQLVEGHPISTLSLASRLYSTIDFLCQYH